MDGSFFYFNPYSGLLLIGVVQGLVYAGMLMLRGLRQRNGYDTLGSSILLVSVLYVSQWMLGFAGWYDSHDWRTTVMFYVPWDNLFLLGPLIWFYLLKVTNRSFRLRPAHLWHALPWALSVLPLVGAGVYDTLLLVAGEGDTWNSFFGTRGPARDWLQIESPLLATCLGALLYVHLGTYLVATVRGYRDYRVYLASHFSSPEGRSLTGLLNLLLLLVIGLAVTVGIALVQTVYGTTPYVNEWYHHLSLSVVAFAAGILLYEVSGDRTQVLYFNANKQADPVSSPNADPAAVRVFAATERRLERHRDYLDPDLRLAQLARLVGERDKTLSAAINARAGMNFNDYVNRWRCAYLVGRLEEGAHRERTLLALALEAGFNSKSTFNRAFRKCYGCSPGTIIHRLESGQELSQKMI